MRIIYDNYLDDVSSASLLASNADSQYPLTNAQDQRLTVQWRTDDGATTQTAVFDLGSAMSCTVFAILGHNLATGGTVTVVGASAIGGSLVWDASSESSTQTVTYNAGPMLTFVSAMSYRYWKFTFAGQTDDIHIGRLWIGTYLTVDPSSLDDFSVTKKRDDIVVYGKGRQKYASVGDGWRSFDLTFPKTGGSMLSSIQTFYDTVGKHSSFIFCNFDTTRSYALVDPCYVSIADDLGFSHRGRQFYTYSITMEEDR